MPDRYRLIYSQDFGASQAIRDFEITDDNAWKITDDKAGNSLELFGKSNYELHVRLPFNIALLKNVGLGDL